MTAPTKAETYAGWVEGRVYLHTEDRDAIAAELRRLSASEAALLEALESCMEQAIFPDRNISTVQRDAIALIAATKEACNG